MAFFFSFDMLKRFTILTIVALYILIGIGGIVRASGAGMGCPDWPKCFGLWIPPTEVSQLPGNYKEVYSTRYHEVTDFNVVKTWTEYINRLIGVLIGFLVFITAILSLKHYKSDKWVTICSVLSFILVAFQGWLGAQVVFFNLKPFIVTLHMLLAIVIVLLLLVSYFRIDTGSNLTTVNIPQKNLNNLYFLIFLVNIQILLGTQVRQQVDIYSNYQTNSFVLEDIGWLFLVHRSYSAFLTFLLAYWFFKNKEYINMLGSLKNISYILLGSFLILIFAGIALNYMDFPQWAQPLHLTFGCVFVGLMILLALYLNKLKRNIKL
ncbi:MAG: COX15/CtaA family protein [Cytophagales bacterium]